MHAVPTGEGVFLLKPITKELIKKWDIRDVDFMGYKKQKDDIFTFHHLLVPARYGGRYELWNGVVLCVKTSHPYLHVIEHIDISTFMYITDLMINEKIMGKLDLGILKEIDNVLKDFEKEHENDRYKNKKRVLKPEFLNRDYSSIK